jgi:hypothetical protein
MNRFHNPRLPSSAFRHSLLLLTSHLSLLTFFFVLPAFSQQRWERTYGGARNEQGWSVQQTTDGGYIVAGYTNSFGHGGYDVYLIKTNTSGDTLWTRTFGGANDDEGYSVQQTSDGGYIVSGSTLSFGSGQQVYLIKTNAQGDILWAKTYAGTDYGNGYSVQQTTDAGYVVAGVTNSLANHAQVYLIKTNATGDTLWTKTYGEVDDDYGYFVQQTRDTGFIIAGYTFYSGNSTQVYLIKTNPLGDTLWTRRYGGTEWDIGCSVQQTTDDGYIVTGNTTSYGNGQNDFYLIKTDVSGDTLWTRTYGGINNDLGRSVQQTLDGGFIITGWTSDQVYLVKTNSLGDTLWTKTFGGMGDDIGFSVQQTSDRGYIITGYSNSYGNGDQVYLIKTDSLGNSTGVEENKGFEGPRGRGYKITPNPFVTFARVPGHEAERFSLFDISGRKVGTCRGDRVGEGLGAGVYFLRRDTACRAPTTAPLRIVKIR